MKSVKVTFIKREDNSSVSVTLYSHYTCLYGKESGEGKSYFVSLISMLISTDQMDVVISDESLSFTIASSDSIRAIVENRSKRYVILIDETSMLSVGALVELNKSNHIFICVCRSLPLRLSYPMNGIYKIIWNEESLDILPIDCLPTMRYVDKKRAIITESREGRSEHELLSVYLDNIVAACGRDRIEKKLRHVDKPTLVFADLGAIGPAYALLKKRCKGKDILFYDYFCFEQLLYESNVVQELGEHVSLNVFDFISIEEYYEKLLELSTKKKIRYKHGIPLSKVFLSKSNFKHVFSGKCAKLLKEYIEKYGNI